MILALSKRIAFALLIGAATIGLSACSRTFTTDYAHSGPTAAKTEWKVAKVNVVVPDDLVVNDVNSYIPKADIVWQGDPPGDRRAQVAAIVGDGISAGVAGLKGPQTVILTATLTRFHSMTPKAYYAAPSGTGVHSVGFDLVVTDARTGALLAGPERIQADLPGLVAADDPNASLNLPGARWKSAIESHIAATMRSWLGTGPDIRSKFARIGA
ncbi:DUF6778 family protein [Pseudogemmobacter sonorensis]|uniref:DUF6778 family protein n=1 Tax=Pseudogemmobacter sonorensis TaxID=2989681 RepID=UPI00367B4850